MLQNRKKVLFVSMTALFLLTAFSVEAKNAKPKISINTKTTTTFSVGVTQKKLKNKKAKLNFLLRGGDDNYTKILLHSNSLNSLNSIDNQSKQQLAGRTVTNSNVTIATDQFKFGAGSALFNGTSSYLSFSDYAEWNFSAGVWAVDAWIRPNSLASERTIFSQKTDSSNNIRGFVKTDGSLVLAIETNGVVTSLTTATEKITANNWHHVAFVENGNDYLLFVDGNKLASLVSSVRPADYTGYFVIGFTDILDETTPFSGYLDEFRLSNGVARWTDTFTLPQKAFGYTETKVSASKKLNSNGKGTVTISDLIPGLEYSLKAKIRKFGEKSSRNSSYSSLKTAATDSK